MLPAPLQIDRLRLDLPGGTAGEGRRLAALVAAGLAAAGTLPQIGDLPNLSLTVTGAARRTPERLAHDIVAQILRALAQAR